MRPEALKALEKSHPDAFEKDNVTGFSTGSLAFDVLSGIGGFPKGCITEIAGWEASGKTTICLRAFAAAQRRGLYPAYLDVERGADMAYAAAIGCDFDDRRVGLYLTPSTFDQVLEILDTLIEEKVPIVFVDSVSGLVTEEAMKEGLGSGEALGLRARMFSQVLPVLTKRIRESGTSVVLVNQLRENIATGWDAKFAPKHKSMGGRAIPYFAWMRVNARQVKKGDTKRTRVSMLSGKEEDVPVSSEHALDILKSKVGVAYQSSPFFIRFDEELGVFGVDNLQTLLLMAVGKGLIQKRGSYYNLKIDQEGSEALATSTQGEDAMYSYLAQHDDVVLSLAKALDVDWSLYR